MIRGISTSERTRNGIPTDITGRWVRQLDWNDRERKIFYDQFVRGESITSIQENCFPYRSLGSLYGFKHNRTALPTKTAKQSWHQEEIDALVVVANAMGNDLFDMHNGLRFDVPLKIADKARWYVSRTGEDRVIGNKTPYNVMMKIYELGLHTAVGRRKANERISSGIVAAEADSAAIARYKRGKSGGRRR